MMDFKEIEEVYKRLEGRLSPEQFRSKVQEKITMLNGLCDSKTAAMLVCSEMGVNETVKIKDITPGNAVFIAKVMNIGEIREFSRDDSSIGRVVNITLADETGSMRTALWDEAADLVKIGDIKVGQSLKVKGYAKEGQRGLEVNVGRSGNIEHLDKEVSVNLKPLSIKEIKPGFDGLNSAGKVLDIGNIRNFQRKDRTAGKVRNITIGDETGKIRVTLWDAKAEKLAFTAGDTVEIMNAYSRENTFNHQTELHVGTGGSIKKSDTDVEYSETYTPIADIVINAAYSVTGYVSGLDEIREFERQDGTKGKVSSIYLSDDSGRIRVTLWGEHADLVNELDIGSEIGVIDAFAKSGMNEEIELSTGVRTSIQILRK